MKLAAHTMATPEMTVEEALRYFARLRLDGAEIVVQSGYKSGIPYEATDGEVAGYKKIVDELGLGICCLTPYYFDTNHLDEAVRLETVADMKRVIDMAAIMEAQNVRVYGGAFKDSETDGGGKKLEAFIKSMRELGDYAAKANVQLAVENHFGTMTTTAKETMRIIPLINHPNVGILYDQANLAFFPAEEYDEAITTQKNWIKHVHVKDLIYKGGQPAKFVSDAVTNISEDLRTVISKIPGDGILDWPAILRRLKQNGYNGWLSLEYERRWGNQNLPIATEGLPIAAERLRRWMGEL